MVVLHNLNRGLRNNTLFPYLVIRTMIDPYIIPATLLFPTWPKFPPPPPSKSHLRIPSFPQANQPYPPPPTLSARSRSTLPSPPLQLCLVTRLPATVGDSEPSLTSHLRLDPANDWMAASNSALPGARSLRNCSSKCAAGSTCKLVEERGGVLVEDGSPPMILYPKVLDVLVCNSSTPPPLSR